MKLVATFLCLAFSTQVHGEPQMDQGPVAEVQILNRDLKPTWKTEDKETIGFVLAAMKRSSGVGSNTHGLNMDHRLVLTGPDSKGGSRWFLDVKSGHFALETPPKLVIYKFKKEDFEKIREKLKAGLIAPIDPPKADAIAPK